MLKDLEEIEKLNWGEESRLGSELTIESLEDRIAISDKNTEKQLKEQKRDGSARESSTSKNNRFAQPIARE